MMWQTQTTIPVGRIRQQQKGAGLPLAGCALGNLGQRLRKRRQQSHQVGAERAEREIPASICVRRTP